MASSYSSSPRAGYNEYDFDEHDSLSEDDRSEYPPSDEDTEDASETEVVKRKEEFTEIKEQMYQDKLAQFKKQLNQLKDGILPEYLKRLKKIEQNYNERLRNCKVWKEFSIEHIERRYTQEKKMAVKEFEQCKIDLKENLIMDLEEKKKHVESERYSMELTGDCMELKVMTRKLRRRPNDPMPVPEKRRKASPAQLNLLLDDSAINEDLKIINKVSGKPISRKPSHMPSNPSEGPYDARTDDGKLYYEKRWFQRGQPVYIESKETGKVSAVVSEVGTHEVWVKRTSDGSRIRIYVSALQKGKYTIRRRST